MKLFKRSIAAILVIVFLSASVLSQIAYASGGSTNGNVLEKREPGSVINYPAKKGPKLRTLKEASCYLKK